MATKMSTKPHICYSLSHKFTFSEKNLNNNLCLVSLERNDLYLTFESKTCAIFDVFTITISIPLLTII